MEKTIASMPSSNLPGWFLWAPRTKQKYGLSHCRWTHSWLQFSGKKVPQWLELARLKSGHYYSESHSDFFVDSYFSRFFEEYFIHPQPHPGVLESQLKSLLFELGRSVQSKLPTEPRKSVVRAKRYLDTHVSRSVSLAEVAREAGVSVPHLCALFKESYGDAPGRYHQRVRMDLAEFFLAERKLPVSRVAERVGYPDVYSFSRMFKRVKGIPPSQLLI